MLKKYDPTADRKRTNLKTAQLISHLLANEHGLEVWRLVVEHWKAQGRNLKFLEIPPELASQLDVPMDATKERRREPPDEAEEEEERMTAASTAESSYTGSAKNEPRWKKRKEFSGDECGYQGCSKPADGYVQGIRSTKEGKNDAAQGRLWFGPACTACVRKFHPTLVPMTLAQLAQQRNGASDLASLLDIELGALQQRLEAAGIDERGQPLTAVQHNSEASAKQESFAIEVVIPYDSLAQKSAEAEQTLAALGSFQITTQEQMDYASSYLQRIKALYKELDEQRLAVSRPFVKRVKEVQSRFKPALQLLSQVEDVLKDRIQAGYAYAQQMQAAAFGQAQVALERGDQRGAAIATQQAIAADVTLSPGISLRPRLRWEVVDPSQVPGVLWSVDPVKVDAAIDAGYREIPGVRIWEEQGVAARQVS